MPKIRKDIFFVLSKSSEIILIIDILTYKMSNKKQIVIIGAVIGPIIICL